MLDARAQVHAGFFLAHAGATEIARKTESTLAGSPPWPTASKHLSDAYRLP